MHVPFTAIQNLEDSLRQGRRRALIQMATGAGKTYTACNFLYRLIKFGGAQRVLFLVDHANLGRQARKEFQAFRTPDDGRLFTEPYNVQHLQSNRIDPVAKVFIATIQRLYSILAGKDLDPELEEPSDASHEMLQRPPAPIVYSPALPIESFDIIVTDECHRSIYNLWRQVLEYAHGSRRRPRQASVNREDVKATPVPLPPETEQTRIALCLSTILDEIDRAATAAARQAARANHSRQAILSCAFSGKLVPQDPADESASTLVERIHAERALQPKASARSKREEPAYA